MVEPTRKRERPPLPPPDRKLEETKTFSLRFVTTHRTRPADIDLVEMATGTGDVRKGKGGGKSWVGGFSGRPALIEELLPHIHARIGASAKKPAKMMETNLRGCWRFLDRCETEGGVERANCVADINEMHGGLSVRYGLRRKTANVLLSLVNSARQSSGMPLIYWPSLEDRTPTKKSPPFDHIKAIYGVVKASAHTVLDRWESQSGPDVSRTDVRDIFTLFITKTGWNPSTVLNIDVNDCIRPHPTDPDRHIVHAIKERGGGFEQSAMGLNKTQIAPGSLIRAVIRRTQVLRSELEAELVQETACLQEAKKSGEDTSALELRVARLRGAARSPWIFRPTTGPNVGGFSVLSQENVNMSGGRAGPTTSTRAMVEIVREANRTRSAKDQISEDLSLTDFRDAFIAFAYEKSGYDWLMAKLAAGHKSVASAVTYLRNRRFKNYGFDQVTKLGEAIFNEIRKHRVVDAAFLFRLVQVGEITDEQRQRWLNDKDRTRMGTGCRDFKHPPKWIAPEHVEGAGCRIQRCILCKHAIVFSDSVDGLCRRLAELQHLKTEISMTTWMESLFGDELEALEVTLTDFPPGEVWKLTADWIAKIRSGEHRVLSMEGAYA